ncbi:MAG: acyl-CoA dehydrogenase family protein [Rhodoferax sp.]|nr:acyl-CoA dehydrogenase family protein [Rhodoferax sp.]
MEKHPDDEKAEREALSYLVTRFATREVAPHVVQWDAAGEFPRALYTRAAQLGLLGLGYPEDLGGTPASHRMRNEATLAMARFGASGGVGASLFSHSIGLPPILRHGSPELQREVIPPVLRGEKIAALAITEPGGGSDVAALRTSARLEGDEWVIDGEKTFITSGMRADFITLAVRTGDVGTAEDAADTGRGARGVSLIVVPGDARGLTRTRLDKMGWHCSDTAQLHFDAVRVPARYLLGVAGQGFKMIMGNFNAERLGMSVAALGYSMACFDEALEWARQRKTFGQALVQHQVIRHKLVDMQMRIASTQAWVDALSDQADAGVALAGGEVTANWVAQVCMLKNHATQSMQFCADQAVQILGGMGFMRGTRSERIYREVKVMMIGGGSEEIMKELAARQLEL